MADLRVWRQKRPEERNLTVEQGLGLASGIFGRGQVNKDSPLWKGWVWVWGQVDNRLQPKSSRAFWTIDSAVYGKKWSAGCRWGGLLGYIGLFWWLNLVINRVRNEKGTTGKVLRGIIKVCVTCQTLSTLNAKDMWNPSWLLKSGRRPDASGHT